MEPYERKTAEREVIIRERRIGHRPGAADVGSVAAAWRESTPLDNFTRPRRLPRNGRQPVHPTCRIGQASYEGLRVGMGWRCKELRYGRSLDNPACVHHSDAVDQLRHDTEVVGDEQDRKAERVAKLAQKAEDLCLHGDIKSGGRLVRDQYDLPQGFGPLDS